ncbi:MAG TPA: macro domain-containing protein [Candidatus Wunengus californicus]
MAFVAWFATFSVMWTLVEGLTHFLPNIPLKGCGTLLSIAVIGLGYAIWKIWQPTKIEIAIPHTNTRLTVKFGDLFAEDGYRAIAVSEYFDSELGLPVSEKSLHGIFLKRCFGGHGQSFDAIVDRELNGQASQTVKKKAGKGQKYPIGTTALVPVNNDKYLCFALCETDPETCKVHADVPMLWKALDGLWQKARVSVGGAPLVVPLVGSGLSGVGLEPMELLDLIILSVITETKRQQITMHIRIVVTYDRFEEIDLKQVQSYWS